MSGASKWPPRAWKVTGLVLAAYLVIILGWHYNILLEITETTIGQPMADKQMHFWDIWWSYKGLSEPGRSFFSSDYIYSPPGVTLWRSNAGFLLFLTAMLPMAVVPDLDLAYNFIALLSLFISCVGGYLLGVRLFKDRGVAFFLGLVIALNPFTLYHLGIGLFEVANLGWAMIYIRALERLLERRDVSAALVAALWYMVAAAWCWYVGYLLVLFSALYFLVRLDLRALLTIERGFLARLCLFGALVGAFLLGVSIQMGLGQMAGDMQKIEQKVTRELAGQFTYLRNTTGGALTEAVARAGLEEGTSLESLELKIMTSVDVVASVKPTEEAGDLAMLNPLFWLLPLLLSAMAMVWRRDRMTLLYVLVGLGGFALSLGPCLVLDAKVLWDSCGYTPYGLLARVVPGLSRIHFPHRLILLTVLAVAILSSRGLMLLLNRAGLAGRRRWAAITLAGILSVAGTVNVYGFPATKGKQSVPATYAWLARQAGDFGVLEVPFSQGPGVRNFYPPSQFAFYQTVHGKRRLFGSIPNHLVPSRRPAKVEANPLLVEMRRLLNKPTPWKESVALPLGRLEKGAQDLSSMGYRYILLHTVHLSEEALDPMLRLLLETLGQPREDLRLEQDPVMIFPLPGKWKDEPWP